MRDDTTKERIESFGKQLARLRKQRNISQQKLAELMGLDNSESISRYERGEREPRVSTVIRIAEALRLHPEELAGAFIGVLDGQDPPHTPYRAWPPLDAAAAPAPSTDEETLWRRAHALPPGARRVVLGHALGIAEWCLAQGEGPGLTGAPLQEASARLLSEEDRDT